MNTVLKAEGVRALERLLHVYWLRPETALWRAFDCMAMRDCTLRGPSLDLGCGDGLLSYVLAGGRLAESHDAYTDTVDLEGFSRGADIYDVAPLQAGSLVDPVAVPRHAFALGLDHKAGLLEKARQLPGFYGALLQADLDAGIPLPDGHFQTVFSNMIYWLKDIRQVLREVSRILVNGGEFYCFVPNAGFHDMASLYFRQDHGPGYEFLTAFDRGYHELVRHAYSREAWTAMFQNSGFEVLRHEPLLYRPVMDVWNIGTRPISHLLVRMANGLSGEGRAACKREWVAFFKEAFTPLVERDWSLFADQDHAFHFFVLRKHQVHV